jgi:hypothetical protein
LEEERNRWEEWGGEELAETSETSYGGQVLREQTNK